MGLGYGILGLGYEVLSGLRIRVWGFGAEVQDLALGYEVLGGLRIRVQGFGAVPCRKHRKNDS